MQSDTDWVRKAEDKALLQDIPGPNVLHPSDIKVNDSCSAQDADKSCVGISVSVCLCL